MSDQKLDLILDILRQHDKRFEQIDKRFEQIDKRFEQMEKRFEQVDHRMERLEDKQEKDRDMLREIYHSRDKVVARVSWDFIWKATAFNAITLVFMLLILKV